MKLDTNFIYIAGYAGHGKDTAKNIMFEHYDNMFLEISMAETLKSNAALLVTDEQKNIVGNDNSLYVLNYFKDNYPDKEFFAGLPARNFLQKLGTEYYRNIYDDIHANFVALKILKSLEENERNDLVFVACDIRFPNELEFMMKMSQLKNEDLKDYLRFLLNNVKKQLPEEEKFVSHFENVFNVNRNDKQVKVIMDSILSNINVLNNTKENKKEWNIKAPITKDMKKEEAIKYGLIHVFRPILNPSIDYPKDMKSKDIVEEIKKYTGLEYSKIADVMKYYKISEVDFTIDNVVKYGYLRADIRHPSENAINDRKPEAILSTPLKDNSFEIDLLKLLSNITIKEELTNNIKKKNLLNRGV